MLIAQESSGSALSSLLFFGVLLVGLYLLLVRPQRARARQLAQVQQSLAVGARVITTAGLHATVVDLDDDGTALLEIAPGVRARFARQAVVQVVDPAGPAEGGPAADGPAEGTA